MFSPNSLPSLPYFVLCVRFSLLDLLICPMVLSFSLSPKSPLLFMPGILLLFYGCNIFYHLREKGLHFLWREFLSFCHGLLELCLHHTLPPVSASAGLCVSGTGLSSNICCWWLIASASIEERGLRLVGGPGAHTLSTGVSLGGPSGTPSPTPGPYPEVSPECLLVSAVVSLHLLTERLVCSWCLEPVKGRG